MRDPCFGSWLEDGSAVVARYLVTTADERTWPENTPILFLGEWCRRYSRRTIREKLDAEVVPYHWDDREKLFRDYQYLRELYEKTLAELAAKLNEIHGEDHSLRYWRILVGPWLGYFIQVLFDRWTMIEYAIGHYEICAVRILNTPDNRLIPNDMNSFNRLYVEDFWNEGVYGQILKKQRHVPVEIAQFENPPSRVFDGEGKLSMRDWCKQKIFNAANIISGVLSKDKEFFLKADYLRPHQSFLLQWRLGQIPKRWLTCPAPKVQVGQSKREWKLHQETKGGFAEHLNAMLSKHMPALYLEGYEALQNQLSELPWPKNPRLIFTCNSHFADDVFKAWVALKVEQGTPLVVGQHGGHYGVGLWSFSEDHETEICDRYFSWGWVDETKPKIEAVGNLKEKHPPGVRQSRQSHALLVTAVAPRYSYYMYSIMVSSQWLSYLNDQFQFVNNLPEAIKKALIVRPYPKDYGWDQIQRWNDRFPYIRLDSGKTKIDRLIRQSRMYISTYNATTFLESFNMDIPTVIFWNPAYWEIRESAVPYFEELSSVGIFHATPESAAKHVATVWEDLDSWWCQPKVRAVRDKFCRRYSYRPNDLVSRLESSLQRLTYENHDFA